MTDFLSSLKADLLDRRLLPLVAVVAVALVAAIAYVEFGGSTATTPRAGASTGPATASSGLATSQKTSENAVAEVTSGTSNQHKGTAHNPFTPLPEAKAKTAATSTTSGTSSTPSGGSSSSTSASGSGSSSATPAAPTPTPTTPAAPAKPSTPAKPKTIYHVAVLFGALPTTTTPLTPYVDLKLLTPLPSSEQPLVVFRGVTAGGKSATFTLVGEAPILHGEGACLPSASQCEALDLQTGKAEQLEYLSSSGQVVSYELKVVSIVSGKASSSAFKSAMRGESKAGRELLRHAGLTSIPYLHYSSQMGVLVFAEHSAFGTGAHVAAHGRHGR